ncbi:T-complex protein 1 subunit alpha [Vitis vinifera]|uniref:T-complex protein 1 subunit alpha n=1 Tax=Vitis vinifera TaxID=29760 RepID=A0A438IK49_VITVI|nr:T-complex protein 1 subunit alpha [Vitis vinifera]
MTKERIEKLLKAGANVVLTTKGIDDMALKASFCACIGYIFLPFMGMTAHGYIGGGLVLGLLLSSMTLDNPRVVAYNQYFVEAGAIAVRRVRKDDMRHVAKATGATMCSEAFRLQLVFSWRTWSVLRPILWFTMPSIERADEFSDQIFELFQSCSGGRLCHCRCIGELRFDRFQRLLTWKGMRHLIHHFLDMQMKLWRNALQMNDVIMIKGTKTTSGVSLILRGANDYMLMRWIGLCMMLYQLSRGPLNPTRYRNLKDDEELVDSFPFVLNHNTLTGLHIHVVAGGGAVEAALSVYLEYLATTLGSREQLAIAEFAESLLIIPKVLAVNAAKDATELVAKLRAYHHTAQMKADKKHLSSMGLDLLKGTVRNNLEAGVIEPAMSKVKILQFATEAAITILRIDDMIKLVKDETQNEED